MTGIDLAIVLLMPAVLTISLTMIYPAVARAKFVREMTDVRDRIEDAALRGELPDVDSVRHQVKRADVLAHDPKRISISALLAMHTVLTEAGVTGLSVSAPEHEKLSDVERKIMADFEDEMVSVLATYIRMGSRFWVPLWCLTMIVRRSQGLQKASDVAPKPRLLATEVLQTPNFSRLQHV